MTPTRAELEQLAQSETVTKTAPPRLWLCVSDEPSDNAAPFPKDLSDVTWAVGHCPVACGVGYVRSDLHNAELTALREAVRVLGREVAFLRQSNLLAGYESRGTKQHREATNANPIAFAAVEKAG